MARYCWEIVSFDLSFLNSANSHEAVEQAVSLAGTAAGQDLAVSLADSLINTAAGRNLTVSLTNTDAGRNLTYSLTNTAAGRELTYRLAGTDAGQYLAASLASTVAGRQLAVSLTNTPALRDLAASLTNTNDMRDLAATLAGTAAERNLAVILVAKLAKTVAGLELAVRFAGTAAGRDLAVSLAGTVDGRNLAVSLTNNSDWRNLAASLAGTDAGQDLAATLAGTNAGQELAVRLTTTDAGVELAASLKSTGEARDFSAGMALVSAVVQLQALTGVLVGVSAAVVFVAGVATQEDEDDVQPSDHEEASEGRVEPARSVSEIVDRLEIVPELDDGSVADVVESAERLVGEVRTRLLDGRWSTEQGHPEGLEADIQGDLEELERQLRPLSGRKPKSAIIQSYLAELGGYVLDDVKRQADAQVAERIDHLRQVAIDNVGEVTGTAADIDAAKQAIDDLAFATAWNELPQPDDVSDEQWDAFVTAAETHPIEVAGGATRWRRPTLSELTEVFDGSMTVVGGASFFAGSVATWSVGTGVGFAAVAAVIRAIVGIIAIRYRPGDDSD